jgi:hypothetical protein
VNKTVFAFYLLEIAKQNFVSFLCLGKRQLRLVQKCARVFNRIKTGSHFVFVCFAGEIGE